MNNDYKVLKKIKISILVLFFILIGSIASIAWVNSDTSNNPDIDKLLTSDEYYEYEVRYGFFRLGNVNIAVSDTLIGGDTHYLIKAIMYSNSKLPFVGYREYHYNSIVQPRDTTLYTSYFWMDKVHRDVKPFGSYEFDYKNNLIYSFEHPAKRDTLSMENISYGGPELMLLSRTHSGTSTNWTYPVAIDGAVHNVKVNYTKETRSIRSGITGRNVQTYRTDGFADLNGPFGFSGSFQGYNTADDLRLPIETKLNVWIGNAVIRLTHFESNQDEKSN